MRQTIYYITVPKRMRDRHGVIHFVGGFVFPGILRWPYSRLDVITWWMER